MNSVGEGAWATASATITTTTPTVTITFNANGGEFDPIALAETFSTAFEIEAYDEIVTYGDTAFIDMHTVDETLFAPLSIATITRPVASGSAVGALPPDPRRVEHTSLGWFTAPTGGSQISASTVVNNNTTFWAGWQQNPTIICPATDMQEIPLLPLTVTWQTISGATYRLTLFNTTTGSTPISNLEVSGDSFEILPSLLAVGHNFRIQVSATVGGRTSISNRLFTVVPADATTQVRGPRVIECFGRNGHVDVRASATSTLIECVSPSSSSRPIWYFVHISGNDFAVRNDATGRYFTATGGNLTHEARIPGTGANYDNRQRWRLVPQTDGTYRIRSVSNPTLYVTEGVNHFLNNPNLSLATLNTNHNRQRWWIGYIWHYGRNYEDNWVAFWDGTINIRVESVLPETHPAGFNFTQRMDTARDAWGSALGITFNDVANRADANIRVYAGCRFEIEDRIEWHLPLTLFEYGQASPPPEQDSSFSGRVRGREQAGTIQAGGATRDVYRFFGTGDGAAVIFVFTGSTRHTNLATFTAMHELGHALGYQGHSPNNNDIMRRTAPFFSANPNETLQPAEIEHLRQIYRTFRNR